MAEVDRLLGRISTLILNPVLGLLFVLALAYFIIGMIKFIAGGDNEDERAKGKSHMIWGILGLFIMVAVYGVITIIQNTLKTF